MRIIKPVLFIAALLLMVEISFRIYLFGINSINPIRMNSYTQIHDSGITRPASIPAVYYELRPDFDGWYKGARFTTSSAGLRDREYPVSKPAETFRVAVLGSSWTMGSGVKQEEIWHSVIETELNNRGKSQHYEFINFGVDQYGLGEIIATLEHKVPAYQPDLILIALTHYTPTVLWPEPPVSYVEQKRRNPFFNFYTLRVIDLKFSLGIYTNSDTRRDSVVGKANLKRQLEHYIERVETFSRNTNIPVAMTKLAYSRKWKRNIKLDTEKISDTSILNSPDNEFVYISVLERVLNQGYKPINLRISNWDSHPNPIAHQLIANAVLEALIENNLIPAPASSSVTP
jgi:hypothetical protein